MAIPALMDITKGGTSAFLAGGSGAVGSSNKVLYNDAGTATSLANVGIKNGLLQLVSTGVAANADPGNLVMSVSNTNTLIDMLSFTRSDGVTIIPETEVMNRVDKLTYYALALAGYAAFTGPGASTASVGTLPAQPPWSSANVYSRISKVVLTNTASTTSMVGWRTLNAQGPTVGYVPGASNLTGFLVNVVWGPATGVSNSTKRAFAGLRLQGVAPTDANPSTFNDTIGMGWDSGDTQVQIISRKGSNTVVKVSLGANFPIPTTDYTNMYELTLYTPPGVQSPDVKYMVRDLISGNVATGTILNSNCPNPDIKLGLTASTSVGGTSAVTGLVMHKMYCEIG